MALFENLAAANRAKSVLLVGGFVVVHTLLLFALVWGLGILLLGFDAASGTQTLVLMALGCHVAAVVLAIFLYVSGSDLILSASGAKEVPRAEDPELHHVVEEMALAAGVPAPAVYRIDCDAANALAVSAGRRGAVVVVTRGLRERLKRDELQAVVAYEVARIRSGDTDLMTLVAGLVGLTMLAPGVVAVGAGALFLVVTGLELLSGLGWFRHGTLEAARADGARLDATGLRFFVFLPLVPLVVFLVGTTPALGRLIQLCIVRERQFLADAEAARLTRYPEALARALEAMASDETPLAEATLATAHLFIVSPLMRAGKRAGGGGVGSSHPDVAERIARLRSIGDLAP